MTPKERERRIVHEMEGCVHFRGIQHETCTVGINLRQLVGGPDLGWARRIPCLLMDADQCEVTCDSRKLPTREEAEVEVIRSDEQMQKTLAAFRAAREDAKAKGYMVGHGGRDSMACPTKCDGTLHYSVAGVNGHMHGRCTTEGCVSWME